VFQRATSRHHRARALLATISAGRSVPKKLSKRRLNQEEINHGFSSRRFTWSFCWTPVVVLKEDGNGSYQPARIVKRRFQSEPRREDAGRTGEADLTALREDLNNLKETVANLVSKATGDAAKSVREMTSNMTEHVSSMAGDLAEKGSHAASAATNQAKTFAAEFESMAPVETRLEP
jgi:vacuolar-type H+-ATPase subunit H